MADDLHSPISDKVRPSFNRGQSMCATICPAFTLRANAKHGSLAMLIISGSPVKAASIMLVLGGLV